MSLQEETELKVDPQHSTSILLRLDEMRQNGEHCDCVLIVGEFVNLQFYDIIIYFCEVKIGNFDL